MFPLGSQRRKKSREFEILVVPRGDGGGTRSISAGVSKLALWAGAAVFVLFLLFFLAFRFTPLGRLVGAQRDVESAHVETERRIRALAEEVSVLKNYNETLRKALGEGVGRKENNAGTQKIEERNARPMNDEASVASSLRDEVNALPAQNVMRVTAEALSAALPLIVPTTGVVTQGFEPTANHFGVDYAAKEGTPVYAAAKGYVLFSGWTYDDGNVIILSHGGGVITVYKHNAALLKSVGALTKRGDTIALVGNTGRTSRGPHLHFEVLKDGVPRDPNEFLLSTKTAL